MAAVWLVARGWDPHGRGDSSVLSSAVRCGYSVCHEPAQSTISRYRIRRHKRAQSFREINLRWPSYPPFRMLSYRPLTHGYIPYSDRQNHPATQESLIQVTHPPGILFHPTVLEIRIHGALCELPCSLDIVKFIHPGSIYMQTDFL